MNLFTKSAPEVGGGTAALRTMLASRARKWSLHNVARDVSERLARDATRDVALTMARNVAGASADDAVLAGVAKGLTANLAGTVASPSTSADDLEVFMGGKRDLSPTI